MRSVKNWADEIVVVDMYSEDRTTEIAKQYGAKVFYHDRIGFVEPARNYAISRTQGDWILVLDADEVVPLSLSQMLCQIVEDDRADVVKIPRLNYLLGAPMYFCGWGPGQDRHMRFFKRNMLIMSEDIHKPPQPTSDARVYEIEYTEPGLALIHFNYIDATQFIEKLNRYTTIEAVQAYDRGQRPSTITIIWTMIKEFLIRYVLLQGFRDGWRGWYLSLFMMFYRAATFTKLTEFQRYGGRERVIRDYQNLAEQIVREHEREVTQT
ncbi:glycosyltransferase family 2 protein [Kyrpidia spormannii]|uniref:Glycosyltransferase family 2 protein n=1 Tax=Kyrpidia spormannii TaxID=2055160 RepID=A0A2K8N5K0_9BACL|nr:glycosyltransferase family 2 protein [Kyrpidia spormannii]